MKCLNFEQKLQIIYNLTINRSDKHKIDFKEDNMKTEKNIKVLVQSFGRFLSGMVMPNIGAFIAWGFITALFIPTGWLPNENFATMVGVMLTYLLPILIGYSGGKLVAGERGGVVGAITTAGVIAGTSIPMFIGAMIAGPVGGYAIKKFDEAVDGKIKSGFEMLVNNFSAGIIGMILALIFYRAVGPLVQMSNTALGNGVNKLVELGLLPLTSVLVEPAKILFLNNAINHGVFSPLGIQQVSETGKSLFFLIEANPGPGLGVLLAYMFFGKGSSKNSASGAALIHFFGGIHEIYFPYILMKPFLLVAVILGGMAGVFTNVILGSGLIAPPSPGSIFAIMALAPKGGLINVLLGVLAGGLVSFAAASAILKTSKESEEDLEKAKNKMKQMKAQSKNPETPVTVSGKVSKIVVACDAGMGSSAMGASVLRKKVKAAGLDIDVTNRSISNLTEDIDIVITHEDLTERAKAKVKNPLHLSIKNFMDGEFYDNLVNQLKNETAEEKAETEKKVYSNGIDRSMEGRMPQSAAPNNTNKKQSILRKEGLLLNLPSVPKEEALRAVSRQLADLGYVSKNYEKFIFERERESTTYIGNYVAIPHGTSEGKNEVLKPGITILQYPDGIDFGNGNTAYFLIGIAGKNNEHIDIISHISDIVEDEDEVLLLKNEKDFEKLYEKFSF